MPDNTVGRDHLRDLLVIGGGCYGCLHTRQLLKAAKRGKIAPRQIVVVDHNPNCQATREFADEPMVRVERSDWGAFLRDWLRAEPEKAKPEKAELAKLDAREEASDASTVADDHLVPAPLAPHLLFEWLLAEVADIPGISARRGECALPLDLPVSQPDGRGNQIISAADWLCPVTCIEPALCPAIRGPRTWELGGIVRAAVDAAPGAYSDTALFVCHHLAWGVGTIPISTLLEARATLRVRLRADQEQRVVVGTVSSCHGILALLEAFPTPRASAERDLMGHARSTETAEEEGRALQ